ncbi:hypothetical protein DUNSADRAFT_9418 [Dunaliella salina]|uniref:Encoded protein n=1 Tax=Dunaliella salina TaxID=3046 RepID=A0ABQ7GHI2_DUNSA|nr:hypothetical protein DUNSADRAFT_9418 [Dunaliella salina]|eukprot:KAF5834068.1 hypothetical protein DUNSADRAFT_9418 [Dunaliella salina]
MFFQPHLMKLNLFYAITHKKVSHAAGPALAQMLGPMPSVKVVRIEDSVGKSSKNLPNGGTPRPLERTVPSSWICEQGDASTAPLMCFYMRTCMSRKTDGQEVAMQLTLDT